MKKITLLLLLLILPGFIVGQNLLLNGNLENIDPLNGGQALGSLPSGTNNTVAIWTTSMTTTTRPSINSNATFAHGGSNFINLQKCSFIVNEQIKKISSIFTSKLINFNSSFSQLS